jgi:hypothetical protein
MIGFCNAMTLDFIPDAMHRLEILLFNRFYLDRVHIGPTHRLADRLRIIGIVFVALDKGLDELRRDDFHRVTPLY